MLNDKWPKQRSGDDSGTIRDYALRTLAQLVADCATRDPAAARAALAAMDELLATPSQALDVIDLSRERKRRR